MSERPARRFWQIHLSTALLLVFTAGGIIWINSVIHPPEFQIGFVNGQTTSYGKCDYTIGWPCALYTFFRYPIRESEELNPAWKEGEDSNEPFFITVRLKDGGPPVFAELWGDTSGHWNYGGLALDFIVGIALLVMAARLFEFAIRRRKARAMNNAFTRRFWQFRLSTAVLLMFGAGAIVQLNLIPHRTKLHRMTIGWVNSYEFRYGFPFTVYERQATWAGPPMGSQTMDDIIRDRIPNSDDWTWRKTGFILNVVCSIGILVVLATVFEYAMNRCEARRL